MIETKIAPIELADWLIGRGQHFISTSDVAALLAITPETVPISLERSRQAGKMISVTKEGWVPVPPEYRSVGAPPASHFIDPLMGHLGHSYYVGFLSAAAIHGASHQASMVFQIVTPAKLRERRIGRNRIQFLQRSGTTEKPKQRHTVPTGRMWVSAPEVTVLDLVESPEYGAGLSNVATVIGDLLYDEVLDLSVLSDVAKLYPIAVVQRTGFLLDYMATEVDQQINTNQLHEVVTGARYRDLAPGSGPGERDPRWHVIVNTEIEHDL